MLSDCRVVISPSARTVSPQKLLLLRLKRYYCTLERNRLLTAYSGHSRLPAQCPVCEHSPLSAEDCKPNKSLRTTIKVFLRTEEKKREQAKEKMRHNVLPAGPTAMAEPEQRDPAGPDASAEVSCSTDVASRGTGATGPKIVVAAATEAGRETLDAMVTNLQDDSHLPHWTHRHGTGDSDVGSLDGLRQRSKTNKHAESPEKLKPYRSRRAEEGRAFYE